MTPQEIFEYKNAWKPKGFQVDVHSDLDVQCKDWCRKNLNRWEWSMDIYTYVYNMYVIFSCKFFVKLISFTLQSRYTYRHLTKQ